jgi:site-specific DNA recombinase
MQKNRAAIYTRISQDRTGAGLGVDRQEKDCRAKAKELGLDVVQVFTDNDTSAFKAKERPGYRDLLEALSDGAIDAVIVWHTDRLHRRTAELEDYIKVAEKIPTYSVKGGVLDLSTSGGRMTAKITGAVAQQEVEHMIERAHRKHQELREKGLPSGGGRPFGFKVGGIEHDETEADLVREAVARVLSGSSLAAIIRDWNEREIPTTRGGKWHYSSFTSMVRRWRNAGIREHKGEPIGPAAWDAIVSEADLRKLRSLLDKPERRTNNAGVGRKHLLSGILTCGRCGGRMRWGKTVTRAGVPYELYQCTGGIASKCRASILKEIAEEEVINVVATRLAFPTKDLLQATADDRAKLDALNAKRAELDEDERQLTKSSLSISSRIKFTEEIDAAREALEKESARLLRSVHLADMFSALTVDKVGKESVGGFSIRLAAEDIKARLLDPDTSLEKRQAVIKALVSVQVLPHPKGVRPTQDLARQRVDITPLNVGTGEPLHQ